MRARLSTAALASLALGACALLPSYLKPAAEYSLAGAALPPGPPLVAAPCAVYKLERYVNTYGDGRTTVYTSRDTYVDQVLEDRPRDGARHDYAPLLKALAPAVARFFVPQGTDCPLTVGMQLDNFIPAGAARYTFVLRLKESATGVERVRLTQPRTFAADPGDAAAVASLLNAAAAEVSARRDELAALAALPVTVPPASTTRVFVLTPEVGPDLGEAAERRALLTSVVETALANTGRFEIVSGAVRDELLALPAGAPPCADDRCRITRLRQLPGLDAVVAATVAAADGGCTLNLTLLPADRGPAEKSVYISTGCSLAAVVDGLRNAVAELAAPADAQ